MRLARLLLAVWAVWSALGLLAAQPERASAADVARYQSTDNGFSFEYPAEWELTPIPVAVSSGNVIESVTMRSPDGAVALINVIQLNQRIPATSVPSVKPELDAVMQAAASQLAGKVVQNDIFDATDYGLPWAFAYQIDYPSEDDTM